ncbi:MAG: hypothetical protein KC613_17820 [Myxococcales bacterium]|nr:hypothetical protein [Myxococcales bacterium]MCB9522579.1 hypothetical protein [Myxococcales bacterium]
MADDKKFSLLDAMVDDHVAGITVDDLEQGRDGTPAQDGPTLSPKVRDSRPVETTPRKWAADPDASICGLKVGGSLEFHNGGPDVDGVWVVQQLKMPLNAAPEAKILVASRPEGGPPYIQISEADLAEELEIGNAVIRAHDERG